MADNNRRYQKAEFDYFPRLTELEYKLLSRAEIGRLVSEGEELLRRHAVRASLVPNFFQISARCKELAEEWILHLAVSLTVASLASQESWRQTEFMSW
jgi:hypothetical protein